MYVQKSIIVNLTLKNTFAKISVFTYSLGTLVHIMTIVFRPPIDQMPTEAHWIVAVLAGYAGMGFVFNIRIVDFTGIADKIIYGLIIFHLSTTVIMHVYSIIGKTNEWLNTFPPAYSYFALIYFASFGYYSFRLNGRLKNK